MTNWPKLGEETAKKISANLDLVLDEEEQGPEIRVTVNKHAFASLLSEWHTGLLKSFSCPKTEKTEAKNAFWKVGLLNLKQKWRKSEHCVKRCPLFKIGQFIVFLRMHCLISCYTVQLLSTVESRSYEMMHFCHTCSKKCLPPFENVKIFLTYSITMEFLNLIFCWALAQQRSRDHPLGKLKFQILICSRFTPHSASMFAKRWSILQNTSQKVLKSRFLRAYLKVKISWEHPKWWWTRLN